MIVGTFTGRLETRDHYDIQTFPNGIVQPIGFKFCAALLSYRRVDSLELIPLLPSEVQKQLEEFRRVPTRASPGTPVTR